MARKNAEAMFRILRDEWAERGIDLDEVARRAMALRIETPSWAYANCGTRFGVVKDPAAPRTAYEKISDAAQVQKFTGITPAVAVHVLWDAVPDWSDLQKHAVREEREALPREVRALPGAVSRAARVAAQDLESRITDGPPGGRGDPP